MLFTISFSLASSATAEEISLQLTVTAKDNTVTLQLKNQGKDPARGVRVKHELDGIIYTKHVADVIAPNTTNTIQTEVTLPNKDGSYPLLTTVFYLNEGKQLSLVDAGVFYHRKQQDLLSAIQFQNILIETEATILIRHDNTHRLRLFLPQEILITGQQVTPEGTQYRLRNTRPEFRSNYPAFLIVENSEDSPLRATKILSARLITEKLKASSSRRIPTLGIAVCGLISFLLALFFTLQFHSPATQNPSRIATSAARTLIGIFLVSFCLVLFRTLPIIPELFFQYEPQLRAHAGFLGTTGFLALQELAKIFSFHGKDYDYFILYVEELLFLYVLVAHFFAVHFLIKPDLKSDKYFQLFFWISSFIFRKSSPPFSSQKKNLALLTLAVKAFYIPLLCSWTINNVIHQQNLASSFTWSFQNVNQFLVAMFILIDVGIFALGYLIELPQLKNEIRSVEPTLLGWIVCIMCYPPFNNFSFVFFDKPLHEYWQPAGVAGAIIGTGVITILWGIYVWATIALGWKASNLTNRGIVSHGPYRYMRHPAYVSKVLLWILGSFFLGTQNFFLVLTLIVVYTLRAWTEERHLSHDQEYLTYKKLVPWAVIPRVL